MTKPAPPTPLAQQKGELGGKSWDPAWDTLVEKALPPDLLSARAARAVAGFCPKFATVPDADKRAFWAYTFQALAGAEAGLDPAVDVHHTEAAVTRLDRVTHRPVRQEASSSSPTTTPTATTAASTGSTIGRFPRSPWTAPFLTPPTILAAASGSSRTRSSARANR